jgi:hypothetical protein
MRNQNKEKQTNEIKYDLSSSENREIIKQFETELAGRDFEKYCYDMGYYIKSNEFPNGAIARSKLFELNDAKDKYKALEILRAKRQYAKKAEHLAQLGGSVCPNTACKYCHPTNPSSKLKLPAVSMTIEKKEEKSDQFCERCFLLKEDCSCINLDDIPF